MEHSMKRTAVLLVCALTFAVSARAAEELGAPPPEPAGTVLRPVTNDTVQEELDKRLVDRFATAAGTSPYLTAAQAKEAGWGFVADHFAEIDKGRRGYVTIQEIRAFLDARAPGDPAAARARVKAAKSAVRKVE